jgi:hypothetical protein
MFDIKSRTLLSPVELRMPRELGEAHEESRIQPSPLLSRWELLIVTDALNAVRLAIWIRNHYNLDILLSDLPSALAEPNSGLCVSYQLPSC